jgi:glycosyltransferase involved in cell wall biosynthesis
MARLAIVSTYPPRRCGIAAYTADLREALQEVSRDLEVPIVAIDRDALSYPPEVIAVVDQQVRSGYLAAVESMAERGIDAVLVQHEFGREYGTSQDAHLHEANLVALCHALAERRMPFLVVLHTVLADPPPTHRRLLRDVCARAEKIIVFTQGARQILLDQAIVDAARLAVIPHGAPEVLRTGSDPSPLRREIAELNGTAPVLTTFGLLSPSKGLEDAITAVGCVRDRHPDLRYVIAGQTHPEEQRHHGERYRAQLADQVAQLGLRGNVQFLEDFLEIGEIAALLRRTTLFVTPYKSPQQASSGVLTYALAAGLPVVSTGFLFANEMLASGSGLLVPCGDPVALGGGLDYLLSNPRELEKCASEAQRSSEQSFWPAIAARFNALIPGS